MNNNILKCDSHYDFYKIFRYAYITMCMPSYSLFSWFNTPSNIERDLKVFCFCHDRLTDDNIKHIKEKYSNSVISNDFEKLLYGKEVITKDDIYYELFKYNPTRYLNSSTYSNVSWTCAGLNLGLTALMIRNNTIGRKIFYPYIILNFFNMGYMYGWYKKPLL